MAVVERIFSAVIDALGLNEIAQEFNREGVPTLGRAISRRSRFSLPEMKTCPSSWRDCRDHLLTTGTVMVTLEIPWLSGRDELHSSSRAFLRKVFYHDVKRSSWCAFLRNV